VRDHFTEIKFQNESERERDREMVRGEFCHSFFAEIIKMKTSCAWSLRLSMGAEIKILKMHVNAEASEA
jgi:hypothetical protein